MGALMLAVFLAGTPVLDTNAVPCLKPEDCMPGFICYDRENRLYPRYACVGGCLPEKPRCPVDYQCSPDKDMGKKWYRCTSKDGKIISP